MSNLTNYSNMLGYLNSWSKEKLGEHLEQYQAELSEKRKLANSYQDWADILQRNVSGFQRRIEELKAMERRKNFVLKREHILLLSNLNMETQSDSYLPVNYKRPLGCSNHLEGIIDALGLKGTVNHYEVSEEQAQVWFDLIDELPLALEAICKIMLTLPTWETPKLD